MFQTFGAERLAVTLFANAPVSLGGMPDFRKSIKLADPARHVDRGAARAPLRGVDGLAFVAWLYHENLFVLVDRHELRTGRDRCDLHPA